jgi:hypothetical protein
MHGFSGEDLSRGQRGPIIRTGLQCEVRECIDKPTVMKIGNLELCVCINGPDRIYRW